MALLHGLGRRLPFVRTLLAHRDDLATENAALRQSLHEARLPRPAPAPPPPPDPMASLCGVVNPAHYENADWLALHHDLSRYTRDHHCFQNFSGEIYRKGWEWTQCLHGLRRLGMFAPRHRALGVGVGRECVIFYLAEHIAEVVATDLYDSAAWTSEKGREADTALLEDAKRHCPGSVDFSKIRFENQDGTALSYADDEFDFAWSLSSIEHFGGHAAAAQAVREMARVVRPGGILAIATEMLLLEEQSHPEYFTAPEIMAELIAPHPNLELIGPVDFTSLPREYLIDSVVLPAGADRRRRHVVLNNGWVQWTSVMLFLRVLG